MYQEFLIAYIRNCNDFILNGVIFLRKNNPDKKLEEVLKITDNQ